jgi:hypothetical protein
MSELLRALSATRRQYALYAGLYLAWGLLMNLVGKALAVAEFANWWQVITCYLFYLVPVSLLLRGRPAFEQYAFGVLALAPLELTGYALGTSIAHEGNFIDLILGPRNFALAMAVFFGIYPLLGNLAVASLERLFFGEAKQPAAANLKP